MDKGPCFGCTKRHPACHDTCPAYKAWRHHYDEAKVEREKTMVQIRYEIIRARRLKGDI